MGSLEHDPSVQLTKENAADFRMSDLCVEQGIEWAWFPERFTFGNGVTVFKATAMLAEQVVVHGTNLSLDEYLHLDKPVPLSELQMVKQQNPSEGWREYEARWRPGTCPQGSHIVHLTGLVTKEPLTEDGYQDLCDVIERGTPVDASEYSTEHFSKTRAWQGA